MKKKIFYWSPCLNPVGTVKSTLNSAISLQKYNGEKYEINLINAFGEWENYKGYCRDKNLKILDFKFKLYKYLPKEGYIQSRLSYVLIYFICFFQLKSLLKKHKPEFLICHLITSLPLTLLYLFSFDTKFILRISGMPRLNLIRKNFWKLISNKIFCVTSPSEELKYKLIEKKIFVNKKIHFLPDAILNLKDFSILKKKGELNILQAKEKKIIFSAGRLTKQKNFSYLIKEFDEFSKNNNDFILIILGEGEEKEKLEKMIHQRNLSKKVFLYGRVNNVFKYFQFGEIFILSSLWEEVGFVIVEAALSNLFVISSDCPNGPTEFLEKGKNGILFKNNKKGELKNALKKFVKLDEKLKMRISLKKNSDKYTMFKHYLVLSKILS